MVKRMSLWRIKAHTAHMRDDAKRVTGEGTFFKMRMAVMIGIMRVHREILKVEARCDVYSVTWVSPLPESASPAMKKMISVKVNDGMVVKSIYRIWVNSSVPAELEARMVVSLNGEILSPKYAPEIIAPAVHATEMPSASPIPISATPMVAMVVHELPVMTETRAQMRHVMKRKNLGLMIWMP